MKFITSDYVIDRTTQANWGFQGSNVSVPATIVVKLSTACSYFCTCIPAKVALWATGTSLMVQNTYFHARYVLRIDITALVWQLLTNILVLWYGFRGQPIERKHFWLQGSNGRCYGNQIFCQNTQKSDKMAITSVAGYATCQWNVWFWDRISAISEFVCSTPVQGKKDRYRGNQFRIKIAINVFIRDSVNVIRLLITEVFRGRPPQRHFWLQGSIGRFLDNQILGKIGKTNISQNGHNFSCMQYINRAFGFVIGFEQSASLSVTLLRNGQRGVTMAINCGTKIATNAFLSEISKMGFLWSANPSKTFLIARVWRTLPRRSNFSQNRQKSHKIVVGVNFNTTWHCYSPHSILVNW